MLIIIFRSLQNIQFQKEVPLTKRQKFHYNFDVGIIRYNHFSTAYEFINIHNM